ncbi:MBL fold metallo-hydrolase [Paracoccus pacificus]|uniref:MBL fold metallo-hydrolase n=1 Tax=Paracoccus pacificus TaxID=1463598 RepID=A0ABW4R5Z9_9RHOB
MTNLHLYGGFGEKGRTSVGVETDGAKLIFDVGIKVGAGPDAYHPAIDPAEIPRLDALFISHAHEDHVGGLSWLIANGFQGAVYMSHEAWAETPAMQRLYACPTDLARFDLPGHRLHLFRPGATLECRGLRIPTGRSGHVPGGAWYVVETGRERIAYCGDMVPHSPVLVMDPVPASDVILLDASYGGDDRGMALRAGEIRDWLAAAKGGCLLPLPVSGKPLEVLALLKGDFAIHHSMIAPIQSQLESVGALRPEAVAVIRAALDRARPWDDADPLPAMPLLTWDGMGATGPSAMALARADAAGLPILLTGHLPADTPARILYDSGRAAWIRLPTHPVASENRAIWQGAGAGRVFGHSSDEPGLIALQAAIPPLDTSARTGQVHRL